MGHQSSQLFHTQARTSLARYRIPFSAKANMVFKTRKAEKKNGQLREANTYRTDARLITAVEEGTELAKRICPGCGRLVWQDGNCRAMTCTYQSHAISIPIEGNLTYG